MEAEEGREAARADPVVVEVDLEALALVGLDRGPDAAGLGLVALDRDLAAAGSQRRIWPS